MSSRNPTVADLNLFDARFYRLVQVAVLAGLKNTLTDKGTITRDNISSAEKRITGMVMRAIRDEGKERKRAHAVPGTTTP